MGLAQGLYEGRDIGDRGSVGLITYMRTDSTRVAEEALEAVRETIAATYGADALPEKPNRYASKKGAQDAHEAIRPTTFDLPPEAAKDFLSADELEALPPDLGPLRRLPDAAGGVRRHPGGRRERPLRAARHRPGPQERRLPRRLPRDPGRGRRAEEEERRATLPALEEGQALKALRVTSEQKFTQPPAQYSEATLVKALEENGIGRPSTYATILSTLSDREYAEKLEGRFRPTALGTLVNQLLQQGFNDILNEGYTAALEGQLDRDRGRRDRVEAGGGGLRRQVHPRPGDGRQELPNVKREGVPLDENCPECGSQLRMRFGRFGPFIACSNYPECKYTRNLEEPAKATDAAAADGTQPAAEEEIPPCEECGKPMALKRSRFGTFFGCTGYPECKNIRKTGPKAEPPKPTGVPCPDCGKGEIEEKRSRRGKIFYSCNRYPDCKFSLWKKPVLKPCPDCGAPFLMEKVTKKAGLQYVCNTEGCKYIEDAEPVAAEA